VSSDPNNNNGTTTCIYDAVGNRKQLLVNGTTANTYTYDANDRLGSDQYDADGNTTNSGGTANTYDFENHMTQHGLVTLVYDGDGNRVSETVGGATTNYLVDTQNPTGYAQVVDELQSGTVARTYSFGLERISETQTLNSVLTASFYGYDGHGSVRQLTSSAGAITDTYDYDAFGNIVNQAGSTPNNYLFAGEQYDPALGVYYNRARYLNTTTGRFWSMDDVEGDLISPISLHKYLYAGNNPINAVDPSGHDFDLGSTVSALGDSDVIGSVEDEEAFTAKKAFSTKIFDAYFVIGPSDYRSIGDTIPIVHAFIYMNTISTGAGTRYDVSLINPSETFSSAVLGVSPGYVVQSPATLASVQGAAFTFTFKVASLSTLQWLAWQGAVEALPVDTTAVSIPYSIVNMVVGTNCIKWSVEAAIAAYAASTTGF
jgi:RHS repeat-associated protein